MKSFSKVLSVFLLVLFCSFFCAETVHADTTAGANTVVLGDVTTDDNVYGYTYNIDLGLGSVDIGASSVKGDDIKGFDFLLFTIPDTKVGQEYVISFDISGFAAFGKDVVLPQYLYLFFGTSDKVSESTIVSSAPFKLSSASSSNQLGPIEFKVDALDGSTPVYLFTSSTSSVGTGRRSGTATFDYPAIPAGGSASSTNFIWCLLNLKNVSYTLQVGGDDLLDEMKHQTDVIQNGMDKIDDSLTSFPGSSDMDASKGQLDTAIGDYSEIEGSLFDSSKAAFEQFDPSTLFNFTVGIYSAIAVLSDLMIEIITMMGEFSVIYTVSAAMIFFGMLIGLWRFFTK